MWMMNCRDISRLVSESMDRKLSWHKRLGVRFHLLMCSHCADFEKQLHFLRSLLKTHAASPENSGLPPLDWKVKEQLRRIVENHRHNDLK